MRRARRRAERARWVFWRAGSEAVGGWWGGVGVWLRLWLGIGLELGLGLLLRFGGAEVVEEVSGVLVGSDGEAVEGRSAGSSVCVLADVPFSMGVRFEGVLKGETKGLERVAEAASRRRRLVAGVEVIVV